MKTKLLWASFISLLATLLTPSADATTYLWNVATPAANGWNGNAANWNPAGNPGSGDTAIFGAIGVSSSPTAINNVVSVDTSITTLQFTNTTIGQYHVTQIPGGVTLTVGTTYTVGGMGSVDGLRTAAMMNGAGTLVVNAPTFNIGNNGSTTASLATNDLSNLSNFVYSASSGTMLIGWNQNRSAGVLIMAAVSNNVTAGTITQGAGGSSNGGNCDMDLGPGTNIINVNNHNVIQQKANGALRFQASTGGLRMRGVGGTDNDRANMIVGNRTATGSGTTTGNALLNDHVVDMKLGTLSVGTNSSTASGVGAVGNFSFNAGTVDALTVNIGVCGNGGANGSASLGTITVGTSGPLSTSGTLYANSLTIGNIVAGTPGTNSTGNLNIFGGTVIITNNISKISSLNTTSTVAVASGTLYVQGRIGNSVIPVDNLDVTNATLQFNVDGSGSITTNAVASVVNAGGTTTIAIAKVTGINGPVTFPLIAYSTLNGTVAGNFTLTVPSGYIASLVDNSAQKRIDLSITPSVIIVPLVWTGATNTDWDTTTSNWLSGGAVATYADASVLIFDDSASNSTVNLTAPFAPAGMTMSNSVLTYTFTGSGSLTGTNALKIKGSATNIVDNTGSNSFTGGISIASGRLQVGNNDAAGNLPDGQPVVDNGTLAFYRTDAHTNSSVISGAGSVVQDGSGTLVLVGANSYDTTVINGGILQVGAGGTSGTLGSGTVTDNTSLVFNRSDSLTVGNVIGGNGSVTKNNNNVLSLNGNNSFAGGLTVNAGTVRLGNTNAASTGTINVNAGSTVVLAVANITNNVTLAGGTLAVAATQNPLRLELTAAASTTSTLLLGDPAAFNAADPFEVAFTNTGTWHGSGTVIVGSVTNDPSPDAGNGLRLRGILPSDFSGILVLSNSVKGELQVTGPGPFSPLGTGKIVICAGTLTNNTVSGTFSELNLRNLNTGNTVIGNDVEIYGQGLAVIDPLAGTTGTTVTMGNLKVGGGQEVGINVNGLTGSEHVVIFTSTTLNGGTATFSPRTPGWNTVPQIGSDLSLGNIGELSPSGLVMNGLRSLFITGTSTYSGSTTISNGVFEVDGAILGTGAVTVAGGTLNGTGLLAGPVTVAVAGTLAPGNLTVTTNATLSVSNSLTLGGTNIMDVNKTGVAFVNDVITNITTLTYGGTLQLNLTGAALAAGDSFMLYSCSSATGAFAAISPATPGTGLLWNTNTLATGVLSVVAAVDSNPTNITATVSGGVLTLSWPADHTGWKLQVQTNALATGLGTNWTDVAGSSTTNQVAIPVDAANEAIFYRMILIP